MFLLDNNAFKQAVTGDEVMVNNILRNVGRVWLSSVAVEELLTGHLSSLNRARSPRNSLSLPHAHHNLMETLERIQAFPVLVYSDVSQRVFEGYAPAILRIGPQDCRIAAQATAHGMTVITRNLRDFQAIGVPCEDWSATR